MQDLTLDNKSTGFDRWAHRLENLLDRLADFLNRCTYPVLFLFSAAYFLTTCYRASRKLFWFDELFTVYLSRLPDLGSLWRALMHGVDFNPPLFYELTRISEFLSGEGNITVRLPAIVGFWIFCLCLFRFVSLKTSPLAGFVAMCFPLVTTGYFYAYDARPHGAVMGFCGLALVCWQAAASRTTRRFWWLLGLGGALTCAMLTHSYAVLLLIPVGVGELTRTLLLRRLDWPLWLTLIASATAEVTSLPLLAQAKLTMNVPYYASTLRKVMETYQSHFTPAVNVLFGILLLWSLGQVMASRQWPRSGQEDGPAYHDIAALCALAALPIFVFLAAKLTGGPMVTRYSISSVGGLAGLLGFALAKRPIVAMGVLLVIGVHVRSDFMTFRWSDSIVEPTTVSTLSTNRAEFMKRYEWMDAARSKDLPIVLLDYEDFLATSYYAPTHLSSRLVHITPNFGGLLALKQCCNAAINVSNLPAFLADHDSFLVFGQPRSNWLPAYLTEKGGSVSVDKLLPNYFLMTVTYKGEKN